MREEYEQNFREIVKKGIQDKELQNINPEVVIFSTLSTLRTLYIWYNNSKNLNEATLRKNMKQVLLNGIV
jgi:hypothetical protein